MLCCTLAPGRKGCPRERKLPLLAGAQNPKPSQAAAVLFCRANDRWCAIAWYLHVDTLSV
eukprot:8253317-Karenia_brevis.AAC.1